jgi:hypothetical protein
MRWPVGEPLPVVGSFVEARVVDTEGVDLVAEPVGSAR